MPTKRDPEVPAKKLPIRRVFPADLRTHFTSHFVVQHQPDFFLLSFFEMWPPMILGETDEEKKSALAGVDHVVAACVSRLVLTPPRMRELVNVLSENLARYEALVGPESTCSEGD